MKLLLTRIEQKSRSRFRVGEVNEFSFEYAACEALSNVSIETYNAQLSIPERAANMDKGIMCIQVVNEGKIQPERALGMRIAKG